MRGLKFTLRGETAFFKKPDVNTFLYFTYSNIHKVALLGVIGAILGLRGYNEQQEQTYPEFYEKLQDLKVAIVPRNAEDNKRNYCMFGKKVQVFNNSVGYASKEAGGNLIVKEQWLEKPVWDIYILENHTFFGKLRDRMLKKQYIYIPYLGKNDHPATIEGVEEVELQETKEAYRIDSLFLKHNLIEVEEELDMFGEGSGIYFKYEEKLPIALEETQNQYHLESFMMTNKEMAPIGSAVLYKHKEKTLYFF